MLIFDLGGPEGDLVLEDGLAGLVAFFFLPSFLGAPPPAASSSSSSEESKRPPPEEAAVLEVVPISLSESSKSLSASDMNRMVYSSSNVLGCVECTVHGESKEMCDWLNDWPLHNVDE